MAPNIFCTVCNQCLKLRVRPAPEAHPMCAHTLEIKPIVIHRGKGKSYRAHSCEMIAPAECRKYILNFKHLTNLNKNYDRGKFRL